jgi:hypothetical protein
MGRTARLPERSNHTTHPQMRPVPIVLLALFCAAAMSLAAQEKTSSGDEDKGSADLIVSSEANAKEVGLPMYPGVRQPRDTAIGIPGRG